MKLLFSTGKVIDLPREYTMQERMDFVEQLMKDYPSEFGMKPDGTSFLSGIHKANQIVADNNNSYTAQQRGHQIERNELVVEYILQLDDSYGKEVLSFYKRSKRSKKELSHDYELTKSTIHRKKDRADHAKLKSVSSVQFCYG